MDLITINVFNEIKWLYIAKRPKKITICQHKVTWTIRVYQKKFGVLNHFFKKMFVVCYGQDTRQNHIIAECPAVAHGKCNGRASALPWTTLCRVAISRHTANAWNLPWADLCHELYHVAHGKYLLCRVPLFCRVLVFLHSANTFFAVCPRIGTRQSPCTRHLHSLR